MRWLNPVLVIAMSLAFLAHFGLIAYYGSIQIQEPNKLILWSEIALLIVILIFGLISLIREWGNIGR